MISVDTIDKIIICTKYGTIAIVHALYGAINDELNYNLFETNILIQSAVCVPIKQDKS